MAWNLDQYMDFYTNPVKTATGINAGKVMMGGAGLAAATNQISSPTLSEQVAKLEDELKNVRRQRDAAHSRADTAEARAQKAFTEHLSTCTRPMLIDSYFGVGGLLGGTSRSKADIENEKLRAEIAKLKACSICDAVERRSTLLVAENAALTKAVSDLKTALESAEARSKIYKQAWRTSIQALDNG